MGVLPVCMTVPSVPGTHGSQKRALDVLELDGCKQLVTPGSLEEQPVFLLAIKVPGVVAQAF